MTQEELTKLKASMPPRYRGKLAKQFKVTPEYIDRIFRGDRENQDILDAAINMALLHKKREEQRTMKIKQL